MLGAVPISSAQGVLTPPDDAQALGWWWSRGARPGARRGGALVTGHTVHTGGGAFDDLEHLKPGAVVRVATDHGALAYAVTQVTVYPKRTLASDAARIFSQSVPGGWCWSPARTGTGTATSPTSWSSPSHVADPGATPDST